MPETFIPSGTTDVADLVKWAAAETRPLSLHGHRSKAGLGRPAQTEYALDMSRLSGILDYEPAELVLTLRPGTLVSDVEKLLGARNQMLAFEPPDYGPLWGGAAARGTIGGAIGCNLAGPRRFKAGALRDHLLGFIAVSGRGEIFKAGAKVVKNVTGYDLPKLVCGAYGTLAALTEVTLKVLPAPEKTRTVLVFGLDDARAIQALAAAAASPHEVAGLAHLPAAVAALSGVAYVARAGTGVTAVRIEGTDISVKARCEALRDLLGSFGAPLEELHSMNSAWLWREIRDAAAFALPQDRLLWRLSTAPLSGPTVTAVIAQAQPEARFFYDWAGGLVWLSLPPADDAHAALVRGAIAGNGGGHATLIRADLATRAAVPVFQPQPEALAALSRRVKDSFDPMNILNPGRMAPSAGT
ncbi:MAG: glycolate oxidase subunit GlcE [Ferrovibrio sp.]|uniref:glycolate oxidase subunit GlcE n=1 Tax=Ferrovibrio sp. TaxID=1917215 RepID=UPI00260DBC08|nr:glycolate oxidase subunit GlcE [Ferrovibrio sp.]MCW0235602.1 glycolate oxidase subunit GlcE [Ferrovibrio sp.]